MYIQNKFKQYAFVRNFEGQNSLQFFLRLACNFYTGHEMEINDHMMFYIV